MTIQHTLVLVEDDKRLRELVADFLSENDFNVIALDSGMKLVPTLQQKTVDVVILDIMLPGESGFELCKKIRQFYSNPILFMTAKNDAIDQILGLEIGADDYVIKPVQPRVLLARLQALLRRHDRESNKAQTQTLSFGGLVIDQPSRSVVLNEEKIEFTSHEFDLLWMLAENAGKVVHRDIIYTSLIGREYDGLDRSADVRISRIRKKLNDNAQKPYRIKTIWGKGFFFVADAWDK